MILAATTQHLSATRPLAEPGECRDATANGWRLNPFDACGPDNWQSLWQSVLVPRPASMESAGRRTVLDLWRCSKAVPGRWVVSHFSSIRTAGSRRREAEVPD